MRAKAAQVGAGEADKILDQTVLKVMIEFVFILETMLLSDVCELCSNLPIKMTSYVRMGWKETRVNIYALVRTYLQ